MITKLFKSKQVAIAVAVVAITGTTILAHPLITVVGFFLSTIAFGIYRLRYHFDSGHKLLNIESIKMTASGDVIASEDLSSGKLSQVATTESMSYSSQGDSGFSKKAIKFDKYGLTIDGKPVLLLVADYDYWHVSNGHQGTWRKSLLHIKSSGVNAVRIRFHWGFHSSAPNEYNFEGDHNVEELLKICADIGLYVIAVVGPYIGEDVQAGGYPHWVIQNRSNRLRHMWISGWKQGCKKFAVLSMEWYSQILPIVQQFQVNKNTTTVDGFRKKCVVLVQLENQLYQRWGKDGLPLALRDEMRMLAYVARGLDITVPFLANNKKTSELESGPVGQFYKQLEDRLRKYKILPADFTVDIEGYVLHPHTLDRDDINLLLHEQRINNMPLVINEIDQTTTTGPFNISHELASALSAGSTIFSMGQLTPTSFRDIFSSVYLHEFSHKSNVLDGTLACTNQGVIARLFVYSIRSASKFLAQSDSVHERPWIFRTKVPAARSIRINSTENGEDDGIRLQVRRTALDTTEAFESGKLNNELGEGLTLVGIVSSKTESKTTETASKSKFSLGYVLADDPVNAGPLFSLEGEKPTDSPLILMSNYDITANSKAPLLRLLGSTKPIFVHKKVQVKDHMPSELWIVPNDSVQRGQMAFVGKVDVLGEATVEYLTDEGAPEKNEVLFSIVEFNDDSRVVQINSESQCVYIVLADIQDCKTLVAEFEADVDEPTIVAWGCNTTIFGDNNKIHTKQCDNDQTIMILGEENLNKDENPILVENQTKPKYPELPFIKQYTIKGQKGITQFEIQNIETRTTNWDDYKWELIPTYTDLENMDDINTLPTSRDLGQFAFNAQDLTFSSCHTVYRGTVHLNYRHIVDKKIILELNGRHRCTVFVNGKNMSGHITLSSKLGEAGSYRGPDFRKDTRSYDVTPYMYIGQGNESIRNEVIVLVESFGLGSQAKLMNDARTPRGLINAYWHGFDLSVGEHHDDSEIHDESNDPRTKELKAPWEMVGVSTIGLDNPYSTSGFPDEADKDCKKGWTELKSNDQGGSSTGLAFVKMISSSEEVEEEEDNADSKNKLDERRDSKGLIDQLCAKTDNIINSVKNSSKTIKLELNPDSGVKWLRYQFQFKSKDMPRIVDQPFFISVKGKATVYVWVDDNLLGRHHGFDLVKKSGAANEKQTSFAWYNSYKSECSVKFMLYGWESDAKQDDSASLGTIPIDIKMWTV